jgi:type III restriction enzyme
LEIRFTGSESSLSEISNTDFLTALQGLLQVIESEIKSNITEYEGSEFTNDFIREVFRDKKIKVNKNDERAREQIFDQQWYAYKSNFGTSEEKNFVKLFAADLYDKLKKKFKSIYLIRNERDVKILTNPVGHLNQTSFCFVKRKMETIFTYQVFVEPKGDHLKSYDKWKEDFMREIKKKRKTLNVHTEKYLVTAVPLFYSESQENEFKTEWENTLAD